MSKKTAKLTNEGINNLPNDKPVVYKIINKGGDNIYTGVAGKGNVRDRIKDHMPGHSDTIPGGIKVQIEQYASIREEGSQHHLAHEAKVQPERRISPKPLRLPDNLMEPTRPARPSVSCDITFGWPGGSFRSRSSAPGSLR